MLLGIFEGYSKMISNFAKRNFTFLSQEQEFIDVIKSLIASLESPTVVRIAGGFVRDKVYKEIMDYLLSIHFFLISFVNYR